MFAAFRIFFYPDILDINSGLVQIQSRASHFKDFRSDEAKSHFCILCLTINSSVY